MAGACPGTDSQDLATILDPFRAISGQTAYLRLEHCAIATIETSETSTLCVEKKQVLSRSSLGCANWSCGPPKLGRLLLNGVRRCRRGPLGPDGPPEGPWERRGVPRGSEHQSCTNT